jgi:NAD(P)-dependent dehydrogenase (short-subunit alcohol dehydrogenase family)
VVFANAGVAAFGPLAHVDPDAWKRCVEVNLFGVFNTVRAALPSIMRQRGYVLINASVSSFAHPPVMSAYAASKSAVEAMGNSWRIELAAHKVDVGLVHAGWVSTPLVTEGALHPGFVRLRATMPGPLNSETSPADAARAIARGMERRLSRIWVPGWLRLLFALRALLHLPFAERELRRAAPEIEAFYLEGLEAEGALASSFGPRERERTLARARLPGSASSGHPPG